MSVGVTVLVLLLLRFRDWATERIFGRQVDSLPRSSADFDHARRELCLRSPEPGELGDRTGLNGTLDMSSEFSAREANTRTGP